MDRIPTHSACVLATVLAIVGSLAVVPAPKATASPAATVFFGTGFYSCKVSHISGMFAIDQTNGQFLWGRPLKKLHEYFDQTPAVPTFPSGGPVFALDRLWTHPGSILKDLKAHVSPLSRVASDHLPLVASIEL